MDNPRTNAELLVTFEEMCFELMYRPTERCYESTKRFEALESRMKNCMGINDYDFLEARLAAIAKPELRSH